MNAKATVGTPVGNGAWHQQVLPERTSVRHGWAELVEHGRELGWDNQVYNWGTGLQSTLDRVRVYS